MNYPKRKFILVCLDFSIEVSVTLFCQCHFHNTCHSPSLIPSLLTHFHQFSLISTFNIHYRSHSFFTSHSNLIFNRFAFSHFIQFSFQSILSLHSFSMSSHPALDLSIGNDDQVAQLSKLLPVHLPNDSQHQNKLEKLRNSNAYIFVLSWLYQCRGFVKLQNEHFDADLFEIELLNLVSPPPVDDSVLFINKLKVGLIVALRGGGAKNASSDEFEAVFREWFGIETPLGGAVDENDETPQLQFDYLFIESKIDVLYMVISYISSYSQFRAFIDRHQLTSDDLKPEVLHSELVEENESMDYILMFDNTRLYKRTVICPELVVPKKRAAAPGEPEAHFGAEKFDVTAVEYELVFKDIYKLDEFLKLIPKKSKKLKDLRAALASDAVVDSMFYAEIRKRKILSHRRKELQLANLLATRKKSTRIEARERERQRDLQLQRQKQEEEMRAAAESRLERRRMAREQASNSYVSPTPTAMTREERLRLRQAKTQSPSNSPAPEKEEIKKEENENVQQDSELQASTFEPQASTVFEPQSSAFEPQPSTAIEPRVFGSSASTGPIVTEPLTHEPPAKRAKIEPPHFPSSTSNMPQWGNFNHQQYPIPSHQSSEVQTFPQQQISQPPVQWPNAATAESTAVHNHHAMQPNSPKAQHPSNASSIHPDNLN